jgi:UDP-N-acetylmuramoylalanine--D-glutamate ligase
VAVAGNIGPTLLGTLSAALDGEAAESVASVDGTPGSVPAAALPEVWVLELSSFQLEGVSGFEPDAAAVLNLTDDHLDWHGSMAHYAAAKARVWGRRAVMVINRNDAQVESLAAAAQAVATAASVAAAKPGAAARAAGLLRRPAVRFGTDAPREAGDYGLITDNGMAWLVRALEADDSAAPKRVRAGETPEREPLHIQHLMPVDALRVRGHHNAANALAALALAHAIGCPLAPMLHGLRDYAGEAHRVEHVATLHGVDAFDDSKGTNVGATVAALEGLGADRAPGRLVVILGGDGKGQDFAPLAAPVQRHARAVATLGRDAPLIEAALAGIAELPLQRHATLEAATRWAFAQACSGDAVLLSPACASLDMFRNYAHRAEVFVAEVQAIAADAGLPA